MNKKTPLKGRWASPSTAEKWPEGIIVVINRTNRPITSYDFVEVTPWFRPDYVNLSNGYGTEPMKFMRLT